MVPDFVSQRHRLSWIFTSYVFIACLTACAFLPGCRSASAREGVADPLADVVLTTHEGKPLGAGEYRGKTLVLNFFFTSCPVVCPAQTKVLRESWLALPADVREHVAFLSVSVDPENDTPQALQRFAMAHAAGVPLTFARASEDETRALTTRLAAFDTTRAGGSAPAGHTTAIYLFDAHGRLIQRYGGGTEASRLAREIRQIDSMTRFGR